MEGSQVIVIIIDHLNHLDHLYFLDFLDEEHHLDLDNVLYLDILLYGLLQFQSTDDHCDNLLIIFLVILSLLIVVNILLCSIWLLQSQSTDDNSDNLLTVGHNLIMNNRSLDVAISIHR